MAHHPRCPVYYFTCGACAYLRVARVSHASYCRQAECVKARNRERMRLLNERHREAGLSLWQKRREALDDDQRRERDARCAAQSGESRRRAYQKRRALKHGAEAEDVTASEIYERDGWVCGICSESVDPEMRWPHPKSPSLDHAVPLSKGGAHTPANVRLAHLDCNVRLGNRAGVA